MIGAVVVLYKPDVNVVSKLIESLVEQVDRVILVDNSPSQSQFLKLDDNVEYVFFGQNKGIASGHNYGLKALMARKFDYAVLFDQDSFVDEYYVRGMQELFELSEQMDFDLAAIGPKISCNFTDNIIKPKFQRTAFDYDSLQGVPQIIASGMTIKVSALEKIGLKEDSLFIDGVDHEWCWRAKQKGFHVAQAKNIIMNHRLGDSRSKFLGLTYKVGSPIRLYYQFRNILILSRRGYVPTYWKVRCISLMPARLFLNAVMQRQRKARLRFMLLGLVDGIFKRVGPYKQTFQKHL